MTEFERFHEWVKEPLARLSHHESGPVFTGGDDIKEASWDRKMSYLLFMFTKGMPPP